MRSSWPSPSRSRWRPASSPGSTPPGESVASSPPPASRHSDRDCPSQEQPMEIRPILSALMRNRTGALLVALQVAITLAVLCNAAFIVQQRLAKMDRPSGYDEENLVTVQVVNLDRPGKEAGLAGIAADLATLRAMPGVVSASSTAAVPLANSGFGWAYQRTPKPDDPDAAPASQVLADEHALETFGLEIVSGRWFHPEEIVAVADFAEFTTITAPTVVITQALADKLFPEGDALGGTI